MQQRLGERVADAVGDAAGRTWREQSVYDHGKQLMKWVENSPNRMPNLQYDSVVYSKAIEGLRQDYMDICQGSANGRMLIVYDGQDKGKSYAMQAVARAKSLSQPDRFLMINIGGERTCEELYENIKDRVLGKNRNFELTPEEVADVIKHGLCGPSVEEKSSIKLAKTSNNSRLNVPFSFRYRAKKKNFPILVIDEFNPSDFTERDWADGDDYDIRDFQGKMGDAWQFFNYLANVAHTADGMVVFVGTKNKAFARALHKINGGTKAALAPCTTIPDRRQNADGTYDFDDWRGIKWSSEDKATVLRSIFANDFRDALEKQSANLTYDEIELRMMNAITAVIDESGTIGDCCRKMAIRVRQEVDDAEADVALRSGSQSPGYEASCCGAFEGGDVNCVIL